VGVCNTASHRRKIFELFLTRKKNDEVGLHVRVTTTRQASEQQVTTIE